jgi:hypothetical protein
MIDAVPKAPIQAILAHFAVAVESVCGADPAKIVKGLDYGDTSLPARAVDGRGDHEECVVNVDEAGRFPVEQLRKVLSRVCRPD